MKHVVWSAKARTQLFERFEYLEERHPAAAARMLEDMADAVARLAQFPWSGHPLEGAYAPARGVCVSRWSAIVVYRVHDDRVEIIQLIDPRQDI